jgi:hypothetical protein
MAKKTPTVEEQAFHQPADTAPSALTRRPSALVDTRVIYCGDNLEQLAKLPDACVDLIYIDPPFNSNRNYEVFWGETREKRSFDDRHASTQAYIDISPTACRVMAKRLRDVCGLSESKPLWKGTVQRRRKGVGRRNSVRLRLLRLSTLGRKCGDVFLLSSG